MLGALALLAAFLPLAFASLTVTSLLGVRGECARFVTWLLAIAAMIVLITEVLSLLYALKPGWFLLSELVLAAAAGGLWLRAGRPALGAMPGRVGLDRVVAAARAHPVAAAALVVAGVALAVQFAMAILVVPNNSDSMGYHLARIGFWLQADTALHFDQGTVRELGSQPNAEFVQGWTLLFSGTDRYAQLVQWFSAVGIAVAIGLGSRVLGFSRPAAAFAGAIFVLLPQPLLQATSTQNDLIVSFLVVAAVVMMVRGIRDRHIGELSVGLVALALAVGTKGTALIAGPSILLLVVAALIGARPPRTLVLRGVAIGAAAFAFVGAFNFVLNVDTYSDPLGGVQTMTKRYSPVGENAVRVMWSFVDSPGVDLQPLTEVSVRAGENLFGDSLKNERFLNYVPDTAVQEDFSSFGLFGLLVFLPLMLVVLVWPGMRPAWRLTAGAALLYLAMFAITSENNQYIGRVLMPGVALGAPLIALLYRRRPVAIVALLIALVAVGPVLLKNSNKPLLGGTPERPMVFDQTRLEQQTTNKRIMRPAIVEMLGQLGPSAPIGLVRASNAWDYVFFGPNLKRRVELLAPEEVTPDTARELGLAGIVYAGVEPAPELDAEPLGTVLDDPLDNYWLVR